MYFFSPKRIFLFINLDFFFLSNVKSCIIFPHMLIPLLLTAHVITYKYSKITIVALFEIS